MTFIVYTPEQSPNAPQNVTLNDIVKAFKGTNAQEFALRWNDVKNLFDRVIEPEFENIQGEPSDNAALAAVLSEMTRLITENTNRIIELNALVAQLTNELLKQGIEIESEALLVNLNNYVNFNLK